MHCPYCSNLLTRSVDGELECKVGRMGLSKNLESGLTEVYELQLRSPRSSNFDYTSGRWFCPRCGIKIEKQDDEKYRCPKCNCTFGEFVYPIVELHFHEPL